MNFSSSNFDIVANSMPGWFSWAGNVALVVFGFIGALFLMFWLMESGGKLSKSKGAVKAFFFVACSSGVLFGLSIFGSVSYNNHEKAAKEATLANVSAWAYNKYGVKLDAGQAGHLVEKSHNLNYPSDVPTWDLDTLAATGNVAYLGKTDVVLREDKTTVVKAQLMKLDSEWYLVDADHAGPNAELKRR